MKSKAINIFVGMVPRKSGGDRVLRRVRDRSLRRSNATGLFSPTKMAHFGETGHLAISRKDEERNIKAGQEALARAMEVIVTPGVQLKVPDGVPLYHADPGRPERLVRVLNGKHTYGTFVNGEFVETD